MASCTAQDLKVVIYGASIMESWTAKRYGFTLPGADDFLAAWQRHFGNLKAAVFGIAGMLQHREGELSCKCTWATLRPQRSERSKTAAALLQYISAECVVLQETVHSSSCGAYRMVSFPGALVPGVPSST